MLIDLKGVFCCLVWFKKTYLRRSKWVYFYVWKRALNKLTIYIKTTKKISKRCQGYYWLSPKIHQTWKSVHKFLSYENCALKNSLGLLVTCKWSKIWPRSKIFDPNKLKSQSNTYNNIIAKNYFRNKNSFNFVYQPCGVIFRGELGEHIDQVVVEVGVLK